MVTSSVYSQRRVSFDVFYLIQTGCTDVPPIWWDSATPLLSYLCLRYKHLHTHPCRSTEIWKLCAHVDKLMCQNHNHVILRVIYKELICSILFFFFIWDDENIVWACHYLNFFFFPPTQNVDKWSFDVFALNEASGDHALKFIFYELLTRYDLISRFKVKPRACNVRVVTVLPSVCVIKTRRC